jgi:hypothetical protein
VSFWSARKSTWQSRQQLILGFAMWATVIAGLAAVEWFRRRQRIAS